MFRKEKICNIVQTAIIWVFEIAIISILFVLMLFSEYNYSGKKEFITSNFFLLFIIICLMICILMMSTLIDRKTKYLSRLGFLKISHVTFFLFFIQVYCCYNFYFGTGWDVGVIIKNSKFIVEGVPENLNSNYFSFYPNNIFLMWLFSIILKFNNAVGILDTQNGLMSIITVQCLISSLTGYLIYKVIRDLMNSEKMAWFAWFIYLILLGTSPWLVITYSDSMALIIPILIFRLYQLLGNGYYINAKWAGMVLLTYWGYRLKPQVAIIVIAIIVIEIIQFLKKSTKWQLSKIVIRFVTIITCIVLSQTSFNLIINKIGLALEKEKAIEMSHFMMMGLNYQTIGRYSEEDVEFSKSFKTRKERRDGNIDVIHQRLNDAGGIGLLKHITKKTLVIFNDGTFAWGNEGHFYNEIYEEKNNVLSPLLKNICWNQGKYFSIFASIKQAIWLLILFLSTGILFEEKQKNLLVLVLSLFGILLFELLFEARARYLYLYVPIFIVASIYGLKQWMSIFLTN